MVGERRQKRDEHMIVFSTDRSTMRYEIGPRMLSDITFVYLIDLFHHNSKGLLGKKQCQGYYGKPLGKLDVVYELQTVNALIGRMEERTMFRSTKLNK